MDYVSPKLLPPYQGNKGGALPIMTSKVISRPHLP